MCPVCAQPEATAQRRAGSTPRRLLAGKTGLLLGLRSATSGHGYACVWPFADDDDAAVALLLCGHCPVEGPVAGTQELAKLRLALTHVGRLQLVLLQANHVRLLTLNQVLEHSAVAVVQQASEAGHVPG